MRYLLTDAKTWHNLKDFVKNNRKNPTYTEKIIWEHLRKNQMGVRFRRQHVIYKYIVDFVCIEKKLIIEIDGESHINKKEYDMERDRLLEGMNFRTIRFTNDYVINKLDDMLKIIRNEINMQ